MPTKKQLASHSWMLERLKRRIGTDFAAMFPAWKNVEWTHHWNCLLALTWARTMNIGPLEGWNGGWRTTGYRETDVPRPRCSQL